MALINDILDLSSIESRRQHLQLKPVEVSALLTSCAELVQPEVQQRPQRAVGEAVVVVVVVATGQVHRDVLDVAGLLDLPMNAPVAEVRRVFRDAGGTTWWISTQVRWGAGV